MDTAQNLQGVGNRRVDNCYNIELAVLGRENKRMLFMG